MDTAWCPGCDSRIDANMSETDLYCSIECKLKDSTSDLSTATASNSNTPETSLGRLRELKRSKSLRQRPSYPWIPLYRRRPVVSRRAAVAAAGSATTAQGSFSCRKPVAFSQQTLQLQSLLA